VSAPSLSPGHEIRLNEDGTLDEVCAWGFVHLEQMDDGHWWLGIDTIDGQLLHVNLWARGKIQALAEVEGYSDCWRQAFSLTSPPAVAWETF
jgi:hypothetical protein